MLTIPQQAGDDGRLFGSVTTQDIADAIRDARGNPGRPAQDPSRRADPARRDVHGRGRGHRRRDRDGQDHGRRRVAGASVRAELGTAWTRPRDVGHGVDAVARAGNPRLESVAVDGRCSHPRMTLATQRRGHVNSESTTCEIASPLTPPEPRLGRPMSAVQKIAVPPHNLEAEKSVLGAVLLDERHLYGLLVEEHLRPEHFYREQHGAVFAAMVELHNTDRKIDHLTVAEVLRDARQARGGRRAGGDRRAGRLGAGRRSRARVRADRARQRADARAADGLLRDPGERARRARRRLESWSSGPSA